MQGADGRAGAIAAVRWGALHARAREAVGEVLALSYFPVQPWLDLPDLGFAVVTVTNADEWARERVALDLPREAWRRRHEFDVSTTSPAQAIREGLAIEGGPIMLADAAGCTGGGATGDSAVVLAALVEHAPDAASAILIVDPETVEQAGATGVGGRFPARIGNKLDPAYGEPFAGRNRSSQAIPCETGHRSRRKNNWATHQRLRNTGPCQIGSARKPATTAGSRVE